MTELRRCLSVYLFGHLGSDVTVVSYSVLLNHQVLKYQISLWRIHDSRIDYHETTTSYIVSFPMSYEIMLWWEDIPRTIVREQHRMRCNDLFTMIDNRIWGPNLKTTSFGYKSVRFLCAYNPKFSIMALQDLTRVRTTDSSVCRVYEMNRMIFNSHHETIPCRIVKSWEWEPRCR